MNAHNKARAMVTGSMAIFGTLGIFTRLWYTFLIKSAEVRTVVRPIMKDTEFLSQKAEQSMPEDLSVAEDLLDTLRANAAGCVGMAANMIGVNKRIIAFDNEGTYMVMFNPEIIKKSGPYETEEGCLSLSGLRKTRRWQSVKVQYQNEKFQIRFKTFTGYPAQIIQHEVDHCDGILI